VPSGRSAEHYADRDSRRARSRSLRLLNQRLYINRSSGRTPARTFHQFATNRSSVLALGGLAHSILEHTVVPIFQIVDGSIERFRSHIISVRSR
jgi:hypothetical protein